MLLTFLSSFDGRIARSFRGRRIGLALALLACSIPAHAQSLETSNAYVEADVSGDGQGLVRIFYGPLNRHAATLTHPANTSYLTVLVNGKYYTNNTYLPLTGPGPLPTNPTAYLQGGRTKKIADTIETVWQPAGPTAFDIVQDIYPVAFTLANSGQIVFKFSIRNHENTFLPAQAQYLLDVEISTPDTGNDNAPITTRYGYVNNWYSFPVIPPYYIATLYPLGNKNFPGYDGGLPGGMGVGYNNDSLAPEPMGLMQPATFTFVDLPTILIGTPDYTWGFPASPPSAATDEALLIQWSGSGVGAGDTLELGRGSYGTPACTPLCLGFLDAMMFHPDHIIWSGPPLNTYIPNHFPVDAIVWNPENTEANPATGTQIIANSISGLSGPARIVSPLPVSASGDTQTHKLTNAGTIQPHASSSISWEDTILQGVLVNCSTDSSYDITLNVTASGVGTPIFFTGACSCPIVIDCQEKDVLAPGHTPHVGVGVLNSCGRYSTYIDSVYDNRPHDLGVDSIIISQIVPANADKVTIGTFTPCDNKDSVQVSITQVDTLISSCVYLIYKDCASPSNISYDTLCFDACLPPGIFDTLPPRFHLLDSTNHNFGDTTKAPCEFQCSKWSVTDSVVEPPPGRQHDSGLDSLIVVDSVNMTFTLLAPIQHGMKEDSFTVCVHDSMLDGTIIIRAVDSVGHSSLDTIAYCTVPDTNPPLVTVFVDSLRKEWQVGVSEKRPWDRGIDSVLLTLVTNCMPVGDASVKITKIDNNTWGLHPSSTCSDTFYFDIQIIDTFAAASFTIQAFDCAGNADVAGQNSTTALVDIYCPTDTLFQLTPDSIMVVFSDFHPLIHYDEGIDSIWFSNVSNMTMNYHGKNKPVPAFIKEGTLGKGPPMFPIRDTVIFFVTDTLSEDSVPTICWNAIDGAGNSLCPPPIANDTFCWTYPLEVDTTPAIVTVSPTCDSLAVTVTDIRLHDRGIYSVWLDTANTANFKPFYEKDSGASSLSFHLPLVDPNQSARGRLFALDVFGWQSPNPLTKTIHTDSLNVWLYKQDLAMKASGIDTTPKTWKVPVYLIPTDTFALSTKGLYQYQFTFHLTGSNLLSFAGTVNPPMLAGWTVASAPSGLPRGYTITGQGPALTDLDKGDTLVYLRFSGARSTDVEEAQIVIDTDQCGAAVIYNGGNDSINSGANYSATLPAPSGRLNPGPLNGLGGEVVFMDSCATIVGVNPFKPTYLSIEPLIPNPASSSAIVNYTVPTEAPVMLELYNELGQKVRTLVAEVQKQGDYQVSLDVSTLPAGTYFLRLASGGNVFSQELILAH